jgi:two-component system nitrogen regulation response regulator GlnG
MSASLQPTQALEGELNALVERGLREAPGQVHEKVIEVVERVLLSRVLRHTHGHRARASALLGINRTTLRTKLRAHRLIFETVLVSQTESGACGLDGAKSSSPD